MASMVGDNALPELLRRLYPPRGVIHVGPGSGGGDMRVWRQWPVKLALLADAGADRMEWAKEQTAIHDGWRIREAVLAASDGEVVYHRASNPSEDGLVPPEKLVAIWPNLRLVEEITHPAIRLDTLLQSEDLQPLCQGDGLWIIIECLPALPILQGAEGALQRGSVLWLRLLQKPVAGLEEMSLERVTEFLQPLGYRCLHVVEENHPALGRALFVRDWPWLAAQRLEQLTASREQSAACQEQLEQAKAELAKITDLAANRLGQIHKLSDTRDEHAVLAATRRRQLDQANAELAAMRERGASGESRMAKVVAACDEKDRLLDERKSQLLVLTRVRDEQAGLARDFRERLERVQRELEQQLQTVSDLNARIQSLTAARDDGNSMVAELSAQVARINAVCDEKNRLLEERKAQLLGVTQVRDEQAALAVERLARLEVLTGKLDGQVLQIQECQAKLESANSERDEVERKLYGMRQNHEELELRQQQLQEELLKAEAQIDLISDVLLREPGL